MRERLRTNRAPGHLLDVIVTDSRSRFQTFGHIHLIDDVTLSSAMRPDARKAIGLQFKFDRQRILLRRVLSG